MKIGFIGGGKVGTALAYLLKGAGYDICGIYNRSENGSADFVGVPYYDKIADLVNRADVLFLTVSDGAIATVAEETAPYIREGQYVLHCSGALTAEVLAPCRNKGAKVYSLHPLQSFADKENALSNLPGSFFAGQGDAEVVLFAKGIVESLDGSFNEITAEGKALYHAGACVASNYLVSLLDLAVSLYKEIGIPEDKAIKALNPLIQGTLHNVANLGTVQALTGPIVRGDSSTVKLHLRQMKPSKTRDLYCALGEATVDLTKRRGCLEEQQIVELEALLKNNE